MPLISEHAVQAAFDYLHENADRAAHARAMRIKAEYATKRAKASAFLESDGTVAEREAKALLSDTVTVAMKAEIDAIEADERFRNQRDKCSVIIEGWRTEAANNRNLVRAAA